MRGLKYFISVIFLLIFLIFGMSGPLHEAPAGSLPFIGDPKVELSGRKYSLNSEELSTVIRAEELPALSIFKELKRADFRGSSCYADIYNWAQANPQIDVRYSVGLPNGETVDNDTDTLDLSSMDPSRISEVTALIPYLPKLQTVYLGSVGEGSLSTGDLQSIKEQAPGVNFDFSAVILGKEVDPMTDKLDLRGINAEQLKGIMGILPCFTELREIDLGSQQESPDLQWADIRELRRMFPEAKLNFGFTLFGQELSLDTEKLDFRGTEIGEKGGQAFLELLPCMNGCKSLDMDSTGVSNEIMEKLREENPDVDIVWRIWFADNYSVRTDTERILASKPTVGGMIYDADVLKYCTKLKYLDVGHNDDLSDLSFVKGTPNLEVLIIAMTGITDLSPLESCPKLEYLEIQSTNIADISVLKSCPALRHLNLGCCPNISDISPLFENSALERLWIGCETPVPQEQVEKMQGIAPGCVIETTVADPHNGAWRYTRYDPEEPKYYWVPRHELLREQLGYNYQEYSFYWLDPLCDLEAPAEHRGKYGKEVYGL